MEDCACEGRVIDDIERRFVTEDSFSLMYRPEQFHAVNESVWTGYPEKDDGDNIPPANLTDGYGIAALYNLELVK